MLRVITRETSGHVHARTASRPGGGVSHFCENAITQGRVYDSTICIMYYIYIVISDTSVLFDGGDDMG